MRLKYVGDLKRPEKQTAGSAGIDLFNNEVDKVIEPNTSIVIKTGVFVEIPENHVGLVFIRSSMGFKHDITLSNSVGVIDSDYRGEIQVKLYNHGKDKQEIKRGDRVAQLVVMPIYNGSIEYVDELSDTQRGSGGFGSTGKNQ